MKLLRVEEIVSLLDAQGYRLDLDNNTVHYYNLTAMHADEIARDKSLKIAINAKIARIAYERFGVHADYENNLFEPKTLREYIEQRICFINAKVEATPNLTHISNALESNALERINHLEFVQNLKSTNVTTKIMAIWSDGDDHKKGYIHNILNYDGFNVAYINSFTYPNNKSHEVLFSCEKGPLWEVNHQEIVVVNDYDEEIPLYDLGDSIVEFTDIETFDLSVFDEDDIKLAAQVIFNELKENNGSIIYEDIEYAYITPAVLKAEDQENCSFYQAEAISLSQLTTIPNLESTTTSIDLTSSPYLSINFEPLSGDNSSTCSEKIPSSFELINDTESYQFLSQ